MRPHVTAAFLTITAGAGLAACDGIYDPSQPGNLVPRTVDEDPTLPSLALAGTLSSTTRRSATRTSPPSSSCTAGRAATTATSSRLKERYDGYALTDDHFLVFWDQRGSGLSRRHDCGVFSLERMDADLDALVEHVSPGRPVFLVGHSWGGMYASLYINRHPDKVAGAVLIEPGPLNGADVRRDHRRALRHRRLLRVAQRRRLGRPVPDRRRSRARRLPPDARACATRSRNITRATINPAPGWRQGAVASRCLTAVGHQGRQGRLRLHRSPERVFEARAVRRQRQERGHRRPRFRSGSGSSFPPPIW